MAEKLLDDVKIVDGKEMSRIPEATHFSVKSGRMLQYRVNPRTDSFKMVEIPARANTLRFRGYEDHRAHIIYGEVSFYDMRGNNLKTYEFK